MPNIDHLNQLLSQFSEGTLESGHEDLRGRELYLYGAGNVGKRLFHTLRANNIAVAGFIDRNPSVQPLGTGITVHLPDDPALAPIRETCMVILSGLFSLKACQDIKSALTILGFRHVYALHEVNFNQVNGGTYIESLLDGFYTPIDILGTDRHKLEHAFQLLQSEADQKLFLNYLKAHLTMDFTRLDEPWDLSLQYLAHDIPEHKDYSRFVDCGGYDGDTFRQLTLKGERIRALAAFEPQSDLYRKYAATLREQVTPPDEAYLFPCGVFSESTQLRFAKNAEAQSAARVSVAGDDVVQCVALDDALQGFAPTFIKMDIEGAETAALSGARKLIEQHGPSLAICVYHRLSDLWEIPWLISSIRSDYRYYLRNYSLLGLETVLYAFRDNQ